MDQYKKRDANIELIRDIGMLSVIMLHCLCIFPNQYPIKGVLKAFLLNGVPLFWIIMGYFLFINCNFKNKMIKTIKNILIPAVITMLIAQIFNEWINSTQKFFQCLHNLNIDWNNLLSNIFSWNAGMYHCSHLWYIFSYVKIVMCFPVLKLLCEDENEKNEARKYFIILTFIAILASDLQHIFSVKFNFQPIVIFTPFTSNVLYVLLGYELSKKDTIKIIHGRGKLLLIYMFCNLANGVLAMIDLKINGNSDYFYHTNSVLIIISSVVLFSIFKQLDIEKMWGKNIIYFFGKRSFYIYLIHMLVLDKVVSTPLFYQLTLNTPVIVQYIILSVIVLSISTVLASCILFIKKIMNRT